MKPVGLVIRALVNSNEMGALVFDPPLGSGTTAVAAAQASWRCFGSTWNPK